MGHPPTKIYCLSETAFLLHVHVFVLCVRTHSIVQKAVWQSSRCWRTIGSCSKTKLQGRCGENGNKSHFIPWWNRGRQNSNDTRLDPLDFEDVIERWIAIATQSIFIFKILKHQRGTTERQFEANMVSWWELWVLAWYLRLLCSTEPVATGDWWVCCLEKLRVPKVISPSLSLSLLFHPSPSPSDTVPSSSPSSTKASSILNCVAMVITFYTVESWDWMITVGKERFTEER